MPHWLRVGLDVSRRQRGLEARVTTERWIDDLASANRHNRDTGFQPALPARWKKNGLLANLLFVFVIAIGSSQTQAASPNFVIIFLDDAGYADIGPFGAKGYSTPNLDRMATEGM